ncbi:hypothetical protein LTSERUB_6746 [Salmonella enterica subsp. enterica serovar Rubislaw str. A4-653]|uniref:Uncharacterized protein n=1 Tax=Salmonella enterica subsp. enterica serovar Rubislaw str. A4-653 TaxID=913081 RepID=G5QCP3_SALRU|nr:hypothetical protein LTSERUB_6746 [Salmonella enterica subsp. enterica serovar Rubislaw str. A4-653]
MSFNIASSFHVSKTKCNNLKYFITGTSRALWRTYRKVSAD